MAREQASQHVVSANVELMLLSARLSLDLDDLPRNQPETRRPVNP
jgi:hypothetical protein